MSSLLANFSGFSSQSYLEISISLSLEKFLAETATIFISLPAFLFIL